MKMGLLKHVDPDNLSVCKGAHMLPANAREALGKYADKLAAETVDEEACCAKQSEMLTKRMSLSSPWEKVFIRAEKGDRERTRRFLSRK